MDGNRALIVAVLLALPAASMANADAPIDGTILEERPVTLDAEATDRLEEIWPDAASVMAEVELKAITYASDGLAVRGYMAYPRGAEGLPAVIFNRGGNREFGALTELRAARILARIASWGYVAVASQYRGNAGGEGREEFGGSEIADVLNLIPLLERAPEADGDRIGMYGWSRGGLMTYLALARTERLAAAIVGAGVTDSFATVEERPEMEEHVYSELVPGWPESRQAALAARSPIRWVEELAESTPILLLHGSSDWRVHPSQALRMATALYESKRPFRFVFFEGGDHGLSEHRDEVDRLARAWLARYVRDGLPWPSLEPHGR